VCVRSRGWGVRPVDQAGVSVGLITQERTPVCGQPRIAVRTLRVELARIKTGNPLLRHSVRSDSMKGRVCKR
jgi:hypothetical protein